LKKFIQNFDVKRKYIKSLPDPCIFLDLGCGAGYNSELLKESGKEFKIYGLDIIENFDNKNYIDYKFCNLEEGKFPYEDNFFDGIFLTHVIEHLRYPLNICKEINRVLKKGGRIYVEAPGVRTLYAPSLGINRSEQGPVNFYDDPTHIKPWTKHGIHNFLLDSNLKVEKVNIVRNYFRLPINFLTIPYSLIFNKRALFIKEFWNLYGWCVYGIGIKA
jgi:SAM-dependent methyltransferase